MGILRLGLILWFAPIILLIILRLLPFVPMATFLAFAYVGGVLIGDIKLVNLKKWAVLLDLIVKHAEVAMVVLFVTLVAITACLC